MDAIGEIHQATQKDLSRVASFINSSPFIHRHLDWRNTFEWLESSPFLILSEAGQIRAILSAAPDPPGAAWIRCFAIGKSVSPDAAWNLLSAYAQNILDTMEARMVAVGLQEWFSQLLIRHGFTVKQKIVVLEWDGHHRLLQLSPVDGLLIRPMESSDIPEVSEVDRNSFEPVWVNSQPSLQAAFLQADHTTVAEIDGHIIGYELSTAAQFNGHLARLAVLPEYRHHAIGRALVSGMLVHFTQRGFLQVTVNTQSDNDSSLHLYKAMGFRPTSEEFPVLYK
jgi:ribosomal protein S18 acetylase RimI-like enzyme